MGTMISLAGEPSRGTTTRCKGASRPGSSTRRSSFLSRAAGINENSIMVVLLLVPFLPSRRWAAYILNIIIGTLGLIESLAVIHRTERSVAVRGYKSRTRADLTAGQNHEARTTS